MSRFVLTAQLQLQAPNNVGAVVQQIQNQLNGINVNLNVQGSAKAQQQLQQVTKAANVASNAAERMGSTFAISIRRFAAFSIATRAVGLFTSTLSDAIQTAIDFERELIKVSQVTGKSMSELRGLTDEISRLSTSLGVSSNSLLEVSTILAQAGLSANDTTTALNTLAKAALAPNFDSITETAEGAIAILAQFKQGVGALESQLGSINAVAGAFAVEASDLIDVIRRTGGVFKSSGGDLNELLALFTSVRATTRESAESIGTGLRTIFTRIQRPKTIEFLKQFGVELVDLNGKFVGPYEAIRRLSDALSGLGEGDIGFIRIAEELGGFRQIGKVLPLLQQFATAEAALNVATTANNSLSKDAASAQATLAIRIMKVKEEFLSLVRGMTESASFQLMANTALNLASALIKLADSLKPILPLLTAVAAVKIASGLGSFIGGFGKGATSNRTFNQGGKVSKFATGGLVPGSGNSDTVPAMLTPGEFVIRKSSVAKLGAENLAHMNSGGIVQKFREGTTGSGVRAELVKTTKTLPAAPEQTQGQYGKLKQLQRLPSEADDDTYGAAFLRPGAGQVYSGINNNLIKDIKQLPQYKQIANIARINNDSSILPSVDDAISKYTNKNKYKLVTGSLAGAYENKIEDSILEGIINTVNSSVGTMQAELGISGNVDTARLLKRANIDQTVGNIFESTIAFAGRPYADSDRDGANDPYDFKTGLGNIANKFNFPLSIPNQPTDAKTSINSETLLTFTKKTQNQNLLEAKKDIAPYLQNAFNSLKGQEVSQSDYISLFGNKASQNLSRVGLSASRVGNRYSLSTAQQKHFGGIIQKFAGGGLASAPLIDDIKNASNTLLPKPGSAVAALIKAGGGAIDIDRTLKRTIGDKAYASAKSDAARSQVLDKYFRDPNTRLRDIQSAPLTSFGKELQSAIQSKQLSPGKLSIVSKSARTPGVAEYLSKLFGIPVSNIMFTSGGSKQPAIDAMRLKGPRSERVAKFATGGGVGTDTVPALLTPGEFVVNKASAQRIGYGNLNRMNKVGKFAKGGVVGVQRFAKGGDVIAQQATGLSPLTFKILNNPLNRLVGNILMASGVLRDASQDLSYISSYAPPLAKALEANAAANKRSSFTQADVIISYAASYEDLINKVKKNAISQVDAENTVRSWISTLEQDTKAKAKSATASSSAAKAKSATTSSSVAASSPAVASGNDINAKMNSIKENIIKVYKQQYDYEAKKLAETLTSAGLSADIVTQQALLRDQLKQQFINTAKQAQATLKQNPSLSAANIDPRTGMAMKAGPGLTPQQQASKTEAARAKREELIKAGFGKGGAGRAAILLDKGIETDSQKQGRLQKTRTLANQELDRRKAMGFDVSSTQARDAAYAKAEQTVKSQTQNQASVAKQQLATAVSTRPINIPVGTQPITAPLEKQTSALSNAFNKLYQTLVSKSDPAIVKAAAAHSASAQSSAKAAAADNAEAQSSAKAAAADNAEAAKTGGAFGGLGMQASLAAATIQSLLPPLDENSSAFMKVTHGLLGTVTVLASVMFALESFGVSLNKQAIMGFLGGKGLPTDMLGKLGPVTGTAVNAIAKLVGPVALAAGAFMLVKKGGDFLVDALYGYDAKLKKAIETGNVAGAGKIAGEKAVSTEGVNIAAGGTAGAIIGGAIGSILGPVGTAIGAAIGATAGAALGAAFSDTASYAISLARAQAQQVTTQKALTKASEDATEAMTKYEQGTLSASEALASTRGAGIELANSQRENAIANTEANKNRDSGEGAVFRNIMTVGGLLGETSGAKNARLDKEIEDRQKQEKTNREEFIKTNQPALSAMGRETANAGGDFNTYLERIQFANPQLYEELIKEGTGKLRKQFDNLAAEAERARQYLAAMNLGLRGPTTAAGAMSAELSRFAAQIEGTTLPAITSLSYLEKSFTEAGAAMDPANIKSAIDSTVTTLKKLGATEGSTSKFANTAQAFNDLQTNFDSVVTEIKAEGTKTGKPLIGSDAIQKAVAEKLSAKLPKESQEQFKNILTNIKLDDTEKRKLEQGDFSVLSQKFGDEGKKFLEPVFAAMKEYENAQNILIDFTKKEIEARRNFVQALRESEDLKMEGRDIQAKYGGDTVTNEERRQSLLNKANASNQLTGLSALKTGSIQELRQRNQEIVTAFAANRQATSANVGAGTSEGAAIRTQQDELKQAQKDQVQTIRDMIKLEEENLRLIGEKNRMEKDSIDALVSGDIMKFFDQQAAVGAQAAVATGNQQLANQFGTSALGAAAIETKRQQEAGVQELYGRKLAGPGGLTEATYGSALSASGIQNPLAMARVAAGTTPQEEESKANLRQLGGMLGETGQLGADMANMDVATATMNVQEATIIAQNAAERSKEATEKANAGLAAAGAPPVGLAMGGLIYANRGIFVPRGTDTIPAMLTPGEFVVNRAAVQRGNNLQILQAMNSGSATNQIGDIATMARGGVVRYREGGSDNPEVAGGSGFGLNPEVMNRFATALSNFNKDLSENITNLANTKFDIQLAPTNINVNLTGTSFLETLKGNIVSEIFKLVSTQLFGKASVGSDGNIKENNSVLPPVTAGK